MIKIKLLGGIKKFFSSAQLEIEGDSIKISDLLDHLQRNTLKNLPTLDTANILVAVNGIDSSALKGMETYLRDGDVVSVIPLIHGGTTTRGQLNIMSKYVELIRLKKSVGDPVEFLESLRQRYPILVIQGMKTRYVLNKVHVKKLIAISLYAQSSNTLLSNKIETDILMRFAGTRQISEAINKVGVKKTTSSFIIIIGKRLIINKLLSELKHFLESNVFSQHNSKFLSREFGITRKELSCIFSKRPLEDLLA
jgi:tRNA threonylcarbamoyladenosine modification (KEOPS) complex Cgi121 subunit/molybdopterin converting factor small subunit